MNSIRVAINGFGRIGRAFFRLAEERSDVTIVGINDLGDVENLAYLLKYDSAYGKAGFSVSAKTGSPSALVISDRTIPFFSQRDPRLLPWKDLEVDVVVESTGVFESYEKSRVHLEAGAKRVVITAPVKDEPSQDLPGATVLIGINEDKFKTCVITSNASCTTNAGSSLMAILHEAIGIEKALLNTVHGYTASQSIVDSPAKGDVRRGRAAAANIVPSSTGAAIAVTKALPELANRFDGIAIRVPVLVGSIADITFLASRDTSAEEVNDILRKAAKEERWKEVFAVTEEPLVSSDIVGNTHASVADLALTRVVGGNLVKVLAWYDNEMGYSHALVEHVVRAGQHIEFQ